MPKVTIDITDAVKEAIAEAIVDNDDLVIALTADVERHDMRAEYVEDSFAIEEVELLPDNRVRVQYQYAWGAHYTCADMCCADLESNDIIGRIEAGKLIFDVAEYEPRSPADEL